MANNTYSILLQALLNDASIGSEIARINKLIASGAFPKINLTSSITNPTNVGGGSSGGLATGTGGSAGAGSVASNLVDEIRTSRPPQR